MTTAPKPIFEMKMIGDVKPQDVPASVLGEFIIEIEKAMLAVLGDDTVTGEESALVSLVDVHEGSNELFLASPATVIPVVGILSRAILTENYEDVPRKAHAHLYAANKICQRRGWGIEIVGNELYNIPHAVIEPGKLIPPPHASRKAKGTTTIIGQVIKVGGVEPKVHIKTADSGKSLYIHIDETVAKVLAGRLYDTVALECRVAWNMEDWSYDTSSIEVMKLADHQGKKRPAEAFQKMRELSNIWDEVDPVAYQQTLYSNVGEE